MQRGYVYERPQSGDRNSVERAGSGRHSYKIQENGRERAWEDYAVRRPGRSASRRRNRQRRIYRSILAIWILAFVIGLLCGKIVFAKDTGLLARAKAGIGAGRVGNSSIQTAENGNAGQENGGTEDAEGIQTVGKEDADSWQLTLVNADHPMEEGYRPQVSEIENNYYFDSRAVADLQQMLADGRKEGLDFWICSAYRTIEKQTALYHDKVSRLQAEG